MLELGIDQVFGCVDMDELQALRGTVDVDDYSVAVFNPDLGDFNGFGTCICRGADQANRR